MKRLFLIITIVISTASFIGCSKKELVGKWKSVYSNPEFIMEFTKDGHVIIRSKGDEPKYGTYSINESQNPYQIDVTLDAENPDPSSRRQAAGIYKFEGNKLVLKLANTPAVASIHPSDFGEEREYMTKELERFEGDIPAEYQAPKKSGITVKVPQEPTKR